MTKYTEKNQWNRGKPIDSPISIAAENYDDRIINREYSCSYCNRILSKLVDRSGLNPSWYCNFCSIEVIPSEEAELRSKLRLKVPSGTIQEAAVSYAPEKVLKRKRTDPKGTFKILRERGINITNYQERGWRKQNEE
jgi:hypothetical protein